MKFAPLFVLFFLAGSIIATGIDSPIDEDKVSYRQHVELGEVHWHRDLDRGKQIAKSTGKPIFLLFQEVPG